MLRKLNCLTVDWPLDEARLFARIQPLIVEIGFGNGDYLIHLALTRPKHNILGLERSSQSMFRAEGRIEKHSLGNARVIHCSATTALAHLLRPRSVHEFHINFPDPWFKKKHHRRRLMQRETVALMTSRLAAGGTLLLATDIRAYAELTHELLSAAPGLVNAQESPWTRDLPGRCRTKYEKKARRAGRPAHFLVYRRDASPVHHPEPIKELDMPHLFLRSPLDAAELVSRFQPSRRRFGDITVALLHAYADAGRDAAVFEVVVDEPTIEQHTMILLRARARGEYMVKMTSLGQARATLGMHRAVAAVGEWVAGLGAGAEVVEWKVRRWPDKTSDTRLASPRR